MGSQSYGMGSTGLTAESCILVFQSVWNCGCETGSDYLVVQMKVNESSHGVSVYDL